MPWKCGVFGVIVEAYTFTRLLESLKKKKKKTQSETIHGKKSDD